MTGRQGIIRADKLNREYNKTAIILSVMHGGGRVMLWDSFAASRSGGLPQLRETLIPASDRKSWRRTSGHRSELELRFSCIMQQDKSFLRSDSLVRDAHTDTHTQKNWDGVQYLFRATVPVHPYSSWHNTYSKMSKSISGRRWKPDTADML